jgi:hypothetical protein
LARMNTLLTNQIAEQKKCLTPPKPRRPSSPTSPLFGAGNAMGLLSPSFRADLKKARRNSSPAETPDRPKPKPRQVDINERLLELPFPKKIPAKPKKTHRKH